MIIKRYIVDDLKEALIRAKYELGKDAIILTYKQIKQGKWFEFWKKPKLEVVLAVEKKHKKTEDMNKKKEIKKEVSLDQILRANPIFSTIREFRKEQILGYFKLNLKKDLVFTDKEIIEFIRNIYAQNCFDKKIENKKINILIGPTGVGKTTTIAKIAAKEHLINKKSVGLITMDTYRIGAVEQLKTYANILGLPFEVAMKPEDIQEIVDKFYYCDIILIDTLGTSQKNCKKIESIEEYLVDIKKESNIYLTLSMSTNKETMISILDRYRRLNYNGLVLTKFDEILSYENFWNLLELNRFPVRYFCYGQDVPEDISDATLENIIKYYSEGIIKNDRSS